MAEAFLKIEKMCYGGAGLGRVEGKACFVPFTAPGDEARIRIVKSKRSYLEGEIEELVNPSPLRVQPLCSAYGVCGGCHWEHLPYEEQLKQKGEIFADTLFRIGRVPREKILPVVPSPKRYGYRSRIQLKVAVRKGALLVGFFRKGSHDVVDLPTGCALADPLLNRMVAEFRPVLGRLADVASVPQIDLSMGDDGQAVAVIHYSGHRGGKLVEQLRDFRSALPSVSGLFLRSGGKGHIVKIYGVDSLSYGIPSTLFSGARDMRLSFSRGGFSQVNFAQNLELIRTVAEWGGFTGRERVLDLYCGNGNISIPVADLVSEVVGIEGYAPSIADALSNAAANGVGNASFRVSDASAAVQELVRDGERFDVVILDPPRAGAERGGEIAALYPEKILYISCDPATLARDLGLICARGYRVTRSKPVDMFPQTYHLESVTELTR